MTQKIKVELTCIVCPNGCQLVVTTQDRRVSEVMGALCNRGKDYASEEIVSPVRTLTTTVKVDGGEIPLVSVRTDRPVPRALLARAVSELRQLRVEAPVDAGTILVQNLLDTGARVLTTKPVGRG